MCWHGAPSVTVLGATHLIGAEMLARMKGVDAGIRVLQGGIKVGGVVNAVTTKSKRVAIHAVTFVAKPLNIFQFLKICRTN